MVETAPLLDVEAYFASPCLVSLLFYYQFLGFGSTNIGKPPIATQREKKNKREIRKVDLLGVLANGWVGDLVLVPTKATSMGVFLSIAESITLLCIRHTPLLSLSMYS
jgi:hypothetical protein